MDGRDNAWGWRRRMDRCRKRARHILLARQSGRRRIVGLFMKKVRTREDHELLEKLVERKYANWLKLIPVSGRNTIPVVPWIGAGRGTAKEKWEKAILMKIDGCWWTRTSRSRLCARCGTSRSPCRIERYFFDFRRDAARWWTGTRGGRKGKSGRGKKVEIVGFRFLRCERVYDGNRNAPRLLDRSAWRETTSDCCCACTEKKKRSGARGGGVGTRPASISARTRKRSSGIKAYVLTKEERRFPAHGTLLTFADTGPAILLF